MRVVLISSSSLMQ